MATPDFYADKKANTPNFYTESETPDFYADEQDFYSEPERDPIEGIETPFKEEAPADPILENLVEPVEKPSWYNPPPDKDFADKSYWERTKDYFRKIGGPDDPFGKANVLQMKTGGASGFPSLNPEQAKNVATEVATIAAVQYAFAPIIGMAEASSVAPGVLTAIAHLTEAGTTGAAVATTKSLVNTGELPDKETLVEEGMQWMAISLLMQSLTKSGKFSFDFGSSVNRIAKQEGVPPTKVLDALWKSAKHKIKVKTGKIINGPDDIGVADVEILTDVVKEAEGKLKQLEAPAIEIKQNQKPVAEGKTNIIKSEPVDASPIFGEGNSVVTYTDKASNGFIKVREYPNGTASVIELEVPEKSRQQGIAKELQAKVLEDYPSLMGQVSSKYAAKNAYDQGRRPPGKPDATLEEVNKMIDENSSVNLVSKELQQAPKPAEVEIPKAEVVKSKEAPKESKPLKTKDVESSKPIEEKPEKSKWIPQDPKARRKKVNVKGKKQAVARSKILDTFRKAFNDPVRLGKIGNRRALGIHKLWPKVSRLLNDNDIETAAHEIGHNLHMTLYGGNATTPKQQRQNVVKALNPYLGELKPISRYAPHGMEGFAEFTRMYVTNPEAAIDLAPKFYAKFEADLDASYPELKNALLEARDYYNKYLEGTPESRIRAQTSYAQDKTFISKISEWLGVKGKLDKVKADFLDELFPAKRMVADVFGISPAEVENLGSELNVYRSLRILKGAVGKVDVFLTHETFNPLTLDKTGESLRDALSNIKGEEEMREFNDYLIARRAIELSGRKIETGIEFGDAVEVKAKHFDKYDPIAKRFDAWNCEVLQYAQRTGMISRLTYQNIKMNNLMYAPFQRDIQKGSKGVGTTDLQAKNPIKRIKGSTRNIIPPVESAIKNAYSIILNSEKNLTGKVLAGLSTIKNSGQYVERVPTPIKLKAKLQKDEIQKAMVKHLRERGMDEFLDITGKKLLPGLDEIIPDVIMKFGAGKYAQTENIVTVYYDGKPTYFEVNPDIYDMWKGATTHYTADLLVKILRVPARTLRAGAILNPKFMLKNFVRDTWGGWLFSKHGKSLKDPAGVLVDDLYSPFAMMAVAAKKGPLYVEWLKAGGGMSTMQHLDRSSVAKKVEEVRKGIGVKQPIKLLRAAAEITEEANRMVEFGRALEVNDKTRLGKEISAFAGRDISIDFAKMGLKVKTLNQIIPFFNATVQGVDKLARATRDSDNRSKFIPNIIMKAMIPALIAAWLNKDDEKVDELFEEEKDFNIIMPINGQLYKIPVPFEIGVITNGLARRMFDYFVKKDPDAFEGFMGSISQAATPGFIPIAGLPFYEMYANKNFFTDSRIIPMSKENLISKYQYKDNTSQSARLIGRAMAYMLGEDTTSKAASPLIIDHFYNSWTGGLGRIIREVADEALIKAGMGDEVSKVGRSVTERLGFDAFTIRYPRGSSRSIEKFYDSYKEATALQKSYKKADLERLDTDENIQKGYDRMEGLYDYKDMQKAYRAMQESQKAINAIYIDPDLDPELKKTFIDELYIQQIQFARAANQSIKQHRLDQKR